jgi:hypothetical protein
LLPRSIKTSLTAAYDNLRRPPRRTRRTTPSFLEMEERTLLSLKGLNALVVESIRPVTARGEPHSPESARVSKQAQFVGSLYRKFYHRAPSARELNFALQQLDSGVSDKALAADFKAVKSRSGKGITDQTFVTALYVTIAGESPTSVGRAYWEGLVASGASRSQVDRRFAASDGLLPAPTVTWANPANITFGTPLGATQLDASASLPGTFTYSPPPGTVLGAGAGQLLSVVFTPADTIDYPVVTDSVTINVTAPSLSPTPTPSPSPTPTTPPMGIIVPSYFAPGSGGPGGVGDGWAAMAAAATQVPITAIFNPNSGPLPGPASSAYSSAFTQLENAGGKVVAYVWTDNGDSPIITVESEISTYITQYGSLIDGFLLDGMLVTPSTLSYYQALDSYIKGLNSAYTVIGNPGQPYTNGVSTQDYLSTADIFNIFEGQNSAYSGPVGPDTFPYGQTWYESEPSDRFSNTIYNVPADASDPSQSSAMLADVSLAQQLDAGYVYITNLSGSNPYDALPSYWDQEVAAIAAL